ncbi:SUKH-3 domain-containing protein [Paenibacillus polymyxa]
MIGEELVVIGLAYDDNATMFMSKTGKVYGIMDDYYIGNLAIIYMKL